MRFVRVNDGKGLFIYIGKNCSHQISIGVNGVVWLLSADIGRLFSFTVWEKNW